MLIVTVIILIVAVLGLIIYNFNIHKKIQTYKIIVKNKSVSNSNISNGKDTTNKSGELENPKTGSYIYIIVIVGLLSIVVGICSYKFYQSKKEKKTDEEK